MLVTHIKDFFLLCMYTNLFTQTTGSTMEEFWRALLRGMEDEDGSARIVLYVGAFAALLAWVASRLA